MIPRKKKACKGCNTPQYIFSNGLCSSCYSRKQADLRRNKVKWGQPIPERRSSPYGAKKGIKKRSDKRAAQEKQYTELCKEIDDEAKANKQTECLFCGEDIPGGADHHHVDGRDGSRLTDKANIKRAHHDCHMDYHGRSCKRIPWYADYLARVKAINEKVYLRDKEKLNK